MPIEAVTFEERYKLRVPIGEQDLGAIWDAHDVEKDRRRWLVAYRGVQFYLHVDRLLTPALDGDFVEVKSRTWSRRDAQDKATLIIELLARLGASPQETVAADYVEL